MPVSDAIVKLVREELKNGVPREKIHDVLLHRGYGYSEINEIFERAEKKPVKIQYRQFFLIIVIVLIATTGIFIMSSVVKDWDDINNSPAVYSNDTYFNSSKNISNTEIFNQEKPAKGKTENYIYQYSTENYVLPSIFDNISMNRTLINLSCSQSELCYAPALISFFFVDNNNQTHQRSWLFFRLINHNDSILNLSSVLVESNLNCPPIVTSKIPMIIDVAESYEYSRACGGFYDGSFYADVIVLYTQDEKQQRSEFRISELPKRD